MTMILFNEDNDTLARREAELGKIGTAQLVHLADKQYQFKFLVKSEAGVKLHRSKIYTGGDDAAALAAAEAWYAALNTTGLGFFEPNEDDAALPRVEINVDNVAYAKLKKIGTYYSTDKYQWQFILNLEHRQTVINSKVYSSVGDANTFWTGLGLTDLVLLNSEDAGIARIMVNTNYIFESYLKEIKEVWACTGAGCDGIWWKTYRWSFKVYLGDKYVYFPSVLFATEPVADPGTATEINTASTTNINDANSYYTALAL